MKTMIAARADKGASELRIETLPVPTPGDGEVLVKVVSAGIAPGMMKLLEMGRFKHLPTTPGHEIAGIVVVRGTGVDPAWQSARVRVHPMLSCGKCDYCTTDREQMCTESAMIGHAGFGRGPLELYGKYHNGGLAEYVCVPANLLDRLPDHVSFDVGAKVHDLANAVRALKCAQMPPSGRLIITAATGTMGTASIKLASFFGARSLVLVGRSRARLEALIPLAGTMPVELVVLDELEPNWVESQGLKKRLLQIYPNGADAVLDFFPEGPGAVQAAAAMALGGTFVHMGGSGVALPFALRDMMILCWRIVGTRACTRSDTNEVLALLEEKKLEAEDLITHSFALHEVNQALEATRTRVLPIWMAIVKP